MKYNYSNFITGLSIFNIKDIEEVTFILEGENINEFSNILFSFSKIIKEEICKFNIETNGTSWSQQSEIIDNKKEEFTPILLENFLLIINDFYINNPSLISSIKYITFISNEGNIYYSFIDSNLNILSKIKYEQ